MRSQGFYFMTLLRAIGRGGTAPLIWSVIASVFLAGTEFAIAFLAAALLGANLKSQDGDLFNFIAPFIDAPAKIAGAFILFAGLRSWLTIVLSQCAVFLRERLEMHLKTLLLHEMLMREPKAYVSTNLVNSRLTAEFPRAVDCLFLLVTSIGTVVQLGLLLCFMFYFSPGGAIFSLAGLVAAGGASIMINMMVRRHAEEVLHSQRALVKGMVKISRNWLFIQALKKNQEEYVAQSKHIAESAATAQKSQLWVAIGSALPQFLGAIIIVALIHGNVQYHFIQDAVLISFLYALIRFIQSIGSIARYWGLINSWNAPLVASMRFFQQIPQAEKIIASMEEEPAATNQPLSQPPLPPPAAPVRIDLQKICFAYGEKSPPIFDHFDLSVEPGEILGISGVSGSGKSTLLGIILGVLRVQAGHASINGVAAESFLEASPRQIGLVSAEPYLIEGSIRQNLDYPGNQSRSDEQYRAALSAVGLVKEFASLSECLNTEINDNGDGLSMGQRQRICIARALLAQPLLLILDEPSANLDEENELLLIRAIESLRGRCTILIVSHRLAMLKVADRTLQISRTLDQKVA